jgi:hypothetical protein
MAAFAFPGVQADVVVIAAGRNERRAGTQPLHQLKSQHAAIKSQRAIEIGDLEMNMADASSCDDGRWVFGHGLLLLHLSLERQAVAGAFADDAPDHRKRLEWVLRHLCAYLIRREQPNSILLKHFDRLRQVRVRIGHDVGISRHLHPLCRSIHFVDRVKEAARGDNGNQVDLIGGNEPRVGFPAGKKHAFSGCPLEDFTVGIHLHLTRKNVKKLVFSRVDMGRWFGALSHLTDNEVKRSAIIRGPRHLASENTFVPGRIAYSIAMVFHRP